MADDYSEWIRATPAQLQRIKALAKHWEREGGGDPLVTMKAATALLINTIYLNVPAEHRETSIETVCNACHTLRQVLTK